MRSKQVLLHGYGSAHVGLRPENALVAIAYDAVATETEVTTWWLQLPGNRGDYEEVGPVKCTGAEIDTLFQLLKPMFDRAFVDDDNEEVTHVDRTGPSVS